MDVYISQLSISSTLREMLQEYATKVKRQLHALGNDWQQRKGLNI